VPSSSVPVHTRASVSVLPFSSRPMGFCGAVVATLLPFAKTGVAPSVRRYSYTNEPRLRSREPRAGVTVRTEARGEPRDPVEPVQTRDRRAVGGTLAERIGTAETGERGATLEGWKLSDVRSGRDEHGEKRRRAGLSRVTHVRRRVARVRRRDARVRRRVARSERCARDQPERLEQVTQANRENGHGLRVSQSVSLSRNVSRGALGRVSQHGPPYFPGQRA
jgi:hypothetical protein